MGSGTFETDDPQSNLEVYTVDKWESRKIHGPSFAWSRSWPGPLVDSPMPVTMVVFHGPKYKKKAVIMNYFKGLENTPQFELSSLNLVVKLHRAQDDSVFKEITQSHHQWLWFVNFSTVKIKRNTVKNFRFNLKMCFE